MKTKRPDNLAAAQARCRRLKKQLAERERQNLAWQQEAFDANEAEHRAQKVSGQKHDDTVMTHGVALMAAALHAKPKPGTGEYVSLFDSRRDARIRAHGPITIEELKSLRDRLLKMLPPLDHFKDGPFINSCGWVYSMYGAVNQAILELSQERR